VNCVRRRSLSNVLKLISGINTSCSRRDPSIQIRAKAKVLRSLALSSFDIIIFSFVDFCVPILLLWGRTKAHFCFRLRRCTELCIKFIVSLLYCCPFGPFDSQNKVICILPMALVLVLGVVIYWCMGCLMPANCPS
jgi:hypothetical protein